MNEKKGNKVESSEIIKHIFLIAALVLFILYSKQIWGMIQALWDIVFPLVLGGAMAYILNIIMVRLEPICFPNAKNQLWNKVRPAVCLLLSIFLILAVLFFVINLIVPELIKAVSNLVKTVPVYLNQINDYIVEDDKYPFVADTIKTIQINWENIGKEMLSFVTHGITGVLNSAVLVLGSFTSAIFQFFVAFSFAIYLIVGKKKLTLQVKKVASVFIPNKVRIRLKLLLETADESFSSFIIGQCTEAVILGALCTVGMMLFRFPNAGAVGAFVGVTALIPIFGAWIGAIAGVLLILAVSPLKALLFLIFILVLQQLESNLIYPRVVGTSIGLPGIWVLAAITIGAGFGGVMGMLLSVPLAATFYKLLKMAVDARA